jgi:hypothetical protein
MALKHWVPERRDLMSQLVVVIGLPMNTAEYNETNPFALKVDSPGKRPATFWYISRSLSTGRLEVRNRIL